MGDVEKVIPKMPLQWANVLSKEFEKPYFMNLKKLLSIENKKHSIFPEKKNIFKSLELTPYFRVKVVIIGQDPYHGQGQANGLAFSVNNGVKIPPSLRNIFKELNRDLNIKKSLNGDLKNWANQGVLLLNSTLTVRSGEPNSHDYIGWGQFTNSIIQLLSDSKSGIVFLLWGKFAQEKTKLIDQNKHYILSTTHPSPFSAHKGFIGSNHFSDTNKILIRNNHTPIEWDTTKQN